MKISFILFTSLCSLALAAPATRTEGDVLAWSPTLAEFYSRVEHHIREVKAVPSFSSLVCDLADAVMPAAPTPLPPPNPGYSLLHVAIGRGVQNYTCDITNATAVPASIGAMANLYNASCIAASYSDILSLLPPLALQVPYPPGSVLLPSSIQQSGVHYFQNSTTPVFDLTLAPAVDLGVTDCKKVANSTAPQKSDAGVNGSGDGAVVWLQLGALQSTGGVKEVYRLNTAGGSPPATCKGMPPSFSIQYAAEYWFWG